MVGIKNRTLWMTGLSGAGKSTLAVELQRLLRHQDVHCHVLDGDVVRIGLNRDLGFSESDRQENIRRVAEVARILNEAGLTVIVALIAPRVSHRALARSIIGTSRFIEIHVATPIAICENRDPKGLYRKARAGDLADFTGVSSPYEVPERPDVRVDTSGMTVNRAAQCVLDAVRCK
jgi:adenylyl-sulfate kinase